MNSETQTCHRCGLLFSSNELGGLCPKCMAKVVFGEGGAGQFSESLNHEARGPDLIDPAAAPGKTVAVLPTRCPGFL